MHLYCMMQCRSWEGHAVRIIGIACNNHRNSIQQSCKWHSSSHDNYTLIFLVGGLPVGYFGHHTVIAVNLIRKRPSQNLLRCNGFTYPVVLSTDCTHWHHPFIDISIPRPGYIHPRADDLAKRGRHRIRMMPTAGTGKQVALECCLGTLGHGCFHIWPDGCNFCAFSRFVQRNLGYRGCWQPFMLGNFYLWDKKWHSNLG